MKLTQEQAKVLESIRGHDHIAAKQIAKETGFSMERTYKALQKLIAMGAMKSPKASKYTDLIETYEVEGITALADPTGSTERLSSLLNLPRVSPAMRAKIRAEMKKKPKRSELAKRLGISKTLLNQVIIEGVGK